VTIVGPVALGKSILLLVLLAELKTMKIRPSLRQGQVRQGCGVCLLKKDLILLSFGMNTLVGDKGIKLSIKIVLYIRGFQFN
jgi:hypothetical protein